MLLASKIGWAGIAFTLITIGMLERGLPRSAAASDSNQQEVASPVVKDQVRKVQETLRDKGHYLGKVDGVFGLRTRASIRGFQKAENLPVTGQLDTQTAGKLGVRPEAREATGYEVTQSKPSAGIKWNKGSRRTSKTLRKVVETPSSTVPPA